MNKIDQITIEELDIIAEAARRLMLFDCASASLCTWEVPHHVPICAHHEWNLDGLVEMIWRYMSLLRTWLLSEASLHRSSVVFMPWCKEDLHEAAGADPGLHSRYLERRMTLYFELAFWKPRKTPILIRQLSKGSGDPSCRQEQD